MRQATQKIIRRNRCDDLAFAVPVSQKTINYGPAAKEQQAASADILLVMNFVFQQQFAEK